MVKGSQNALECGVWGSGCFFWYGRACGSVRHFRGFGILCLLSHSSPASPHCRFQWVTFWGDAFRDKGMEVESWSRADLKLLRWWSLLYAPGNLTKEDPAPVYLSLGFDSHALNCTRYIILFNVFSRIRLLSLLSCLLPYLPLAWCLAIGLVLPGNVSGSLTHLCLVVLGWIKPSSDPDPTLSASPPLGSCSPPSSNNSSSSGGKQFLERETKKR